MAGVKGWVLEEVVGLQQFGLRQRHRHQEGLIKQSPTDLCQVPAALLLVLFSIDRGRAQHRCAEPVRKAPCHPPPAAQIRLYQNLVIYKKMTKEGGHIMPIWGLWGVVVEGAG